MEEEPIIQAYWPDTPIHKRLMHFVSIRQNGRCQSCRRPFTGNELIVRSDTRAARYYHFDCAERRRIDDNPIKVLSPIPDHNDIHLFTSGR